MVSDKVQENRKSNAEEGHVDDKAVSALCMLSDNVLDNIQETRQAEMLTTASPRAENRSQELMATTVDGGWWHEE
jgi:hypothetical protein